MNDPGLDGTIQDTATHVTRSLRERIPSSEDDVTRNGKLENSKKSSSAAEEFRQELQVDEDEEEIGYFAPQYVRDAWPKKIRH